MKDQERGNTEYFDSNFLHTFKSIAVKLRIFLCKILNNAISYLIIHNKKNIVNIPAFLNT